ncbi:MAG TPA: glucose 1-dehydrogenase [Phycisphaerae bacterium]|nr:glucose 1-dehydrogenase [Phycisphaerae bacterium]
MKAVAAYPGERILALTDHETPMLRTPTDVKIRILDVGICGTDKEICAFEYGTPPPGCDHLVIGHEALGEVVDVGPAVTRVKRGDLVVPMVRRPCRHDDCLACREGRQDFCYTGDFTERGIRLEHGFMTELVVDDERYMHVVPRELRDVAVLVEPLTIAQKAVTQVWQVQQRLPWACPIEPGRPPRYCHRAVVLGAGPVGLLGAISLAAAGFQTFVYSRERAPSPRSLLIEQFGAEYLCSETCPVDQLVQRVGNIDLIFEAVGASGLAFSVIRVLGTNGVFVFTGVPGRKAPIEVDTDLIMRDMVLKNQVLFGTVNAGAETYTAAIEALQDFMQRWPEAVRGLITARRPLSAYRELLLGRPEGIKNVITFEGGGK